MNFRFLSSSLVLSSLAQASTILVGGAINNGDFNDESLATSPNTAVRRFFETPSWEHIFAGPNSVAPATMVTPIMPGPGGSFDGTLHAFIRTGNFFGVAASGASGSYLMQAGDTYSISYVWQELPNFSGNVDLLRVILFTTNDGTVWGSPSVLATIDAPSVSNPGGYESVDQNGVYTAVAGDMGKTLFVGIETVDVDGLNGPPQARLDNFVISIPETSTSLLGLISLVVFGFRRVR